MALSNGTWTVCNTQNTAVLRDFAPALLCCPQFGRYDDIFASLICQRIMREKGYVVHFGGPLVWQQRNKHDLIVDLKAELWGMEHVVKLAEALNHILVFERQAHPVRQVYDTLQHFSWFPKEANTLAQAFMDALAGAADPQGIVRLSALTEAMENDVQSLTKDRQHLGSHTNFNDKLFVASHY